jgi:hypothetical protein
MIGDNAPRAWEHASKEKRAGYILAVQGVIDHPDISPEKQHMEWCDSMYAKGWTYGHELSEGNRVHPNLLKYQDLPQEQRIKDWVFLSVVKGLLSAVSSSKSKAQEDPAT